MAIIFALVFVLISSKLYLDHSNILTSHVKGIITNIQKDFYRTNDLDFSRVKNYKISYKFKVNNHFYKNMIVIEQNDFKYYSNLNSDLKVGDSLNIEYDKADLFKNRIKK